MSKVEPKTKINPNVSLLEPPLFKVIYVNDNVTSMDFVVRSLMEYFEFTESTAETITMEIHNQGSSVVAVLPYEIAEQKGIEITLHARAEGYPLQIKVEAES